MKSVCAVDGLSGLTVDEDDKEYYHPPLSEGSIVRKVIEIPNITKSWFYKFFRFMFFCKKVQWDFRAQLINLSTRWSRFHHHYILGLTGNSKDVHNISPETYTTRDSSRNTYRILRIKDTLLSKRK